MEIILIGTPMNLKKEPKPRMKRLTTIDRSAILGVLSLGMVNTLMTDDEIRFQEAIIDPILVSINFNMTINTSC